MFIHLVDFGSVLVYIYNMLTTPSQTSIFTRPHALPLMRNLGTKLAGGIDFLTLALMP